MSSLQSARVQRLDHVNVQTNELEATRAFYVDVIGLRVGERPPFDFPGLWLYADSTAVIHVTGRSGQTVHGAGSGAVDHIAFRVAGLASMRERLARLQIAVNENVVPRNGDIQIFLIDPNGLRIELTFAAAELAVSEALVER